MASRAVTVATALRSGRARLARAGVENPSLDATVLLADSLGVSKEHLLARTTEHVDGRGHASFRRALMLRSRAVPVAYIRGRKEFYGRDFAVDRRVLIPRPETELLVESTIEIVRGDASVTRVHDVGTGSGCIALTLRAECPHLRVHASDLDRGSLAVFRTNQDRILGRPQVTSSAGDLLDGAPLVDLIVSNPPYVDAETCRAMEAREWPEPMSALLGGPSGEELTTRLIRQAATRLRSGGYLLLEVDSRAAATLVRPLRNVGFRDVRVRADLAGLPRVAIARRR